MSAQLEMTFTWLTAAMGSRQNAEDADGVVRKAGFGLAATAGVPRTKSEAERT